jgi:hypothetical protein
MGAAHVCEWADRLCVRTLTIADEAIEQNRCAAGMGQIRPFASIEPHAGFYPNELTFPVAIVFLRVGPIADYRLTCEQRKLVERLSD